MPEYNPILDHAREYILNNKSLNVFNTSKEFARAESEEAVFGDSKTVHPENYSFLLTGREDNPDYIEAELQSKTDRVFNGLARLGLGALTKTGAGIGYATSALPALAVWDINVMTENPLSQMFNKAEELMKEALPVHKTRAYTEGNILQQMGTVSFWADDVSDGLAFLLSAYAGGYISKPIQIGSEVVKGLAKLSEAVTKATAKKALINAMKILGEGGKGWDLATITAYNTLTEAAVEAHEVGQQLKQEFSDQINDELEKALANIEKEKLALPLSNLSPDATLEERERWQKQRELQLKAIEDKYMAPIKRRMDEFKIKRSVAQRNTFLANVAALSFSNSWETTMLFGKKSGIGALLKNRFVNGALDQTSKSTAKTFAQKFAQNAAKGIAAEGLWEENVQLGISNYEERLAKGLDNRPRLLAIASNMVDNLITDEGQKSIVLGSVIGIIGGFGGAVKETNEETKKLKALDNMLKINDAVYNANIQSLYKIFGEEEKDGKKVPVYINPATGQTEIDPEAVSKMAYQLLVEKNLMDETMAASINQDETHFNLNKAVAMSRMVYRMLEQEDGEEVLDAMLRSITDPNDEMSVKHNLAKDEQLYQKLKLLYKELAGKIKETDDKTESEFNKALKASRFYHGVVTIAANKAIEDRREKIAKMHEPLTEKEKQKEEEYIQSLEKVIADANQAIINLKENTEKLKKQWLSKRSFITEKTERIKSLTNKKDRSAEENNELAKLNYEIEEYNAIENGSDIFTINQDEFIRKNLKEGLRNETGLQVALDAIKDLQIDEQMEAGASPTEVLDTMKSKNFTGSQDVDKFKEYLNTERERIQQLKQKLEDESNAMNPIWSKLEDVETEVLGMAGEQHSEEEWDDIINQSSLLNDEKEDLRAQMKKVMSIEAQKQLLDDELALMEAIDDNLSFISQRQIKQNESEEKKSLLEGWFDEFLKYKYARSFIDVARSIEDSYNALVEKDRADEFIPTEEILKKLLKLETIKKVFEMRKDEFQNTEKYQEFMDELGNTIEVLEKLLSIAKANESRLDAEQTEAYRAERSRKLRGFGIENGEIDDEFRPIMESILGEDLLTRIINDSKNSNSPTFGDIIAHYAQNATSDQKRALADLADKRMEAILKDLNQRFQGCFGANYAENPSRNIAQSVFNLINKFYFRGYDIKNQKSIVRKLSSSHAYDNILKLIAKDEQLQGPESEKQNLRDYIEYAFAQHRVYEALHSMKLNLNSDFDLKKELEEEAKLTIELVEVLKNEKTVKAPSLQQLNAIRQIVKFLSGKVNDIAYLKGLAGTGKTMIVMKYALRLSGIDPNTVLAFGHTPESSKTIADSLNAVQSTTEDFLNRTDFEGITTVVFDEVMGAPYKTFTDVYKKLNELNRQRKSENKKPIKMVALGDPTQITENNSTDAAIENFTIKGVTYINPLTTRFRSDIGSIVEIQDLFHDNFQEVDTIIAKSNEKDISALPDVVEGAHVGGRGDLRTVLKHNKTKSPGRTRVILVANDDAKAAYADVGVETLTYIEAQGRTWDEVYVDISQTDKGTHTNWANDVYEYNKAMYTATSRAASYLFVMNTGSKNINLTDKDLEKNKNEKKDFVNSMFEIFQQATLESREIAGKYNLKVNVPANTIIKGTVAGSHLTTDEEQKAENEFETNEPDDITVTDDSELDDNTSDPNNPSMSSDVAPGSVLENNGVNVHSIQSPSYNPVKSLIEIIVENGNKVFKRTKSLVRENSKVLYLALEDKDTGKRYVGIFGAQQMPDGTPNNMYSMIGVMTDDELEHTEFGRSLQAKLETAELSSRIKTNNTETVTPGTILAEGYITKKQSLSFEYQKDFSTSPDFIEEISHQLLNIFSIESNREFVKEQLKNKMSVRIFGRKEALNRGLKAGIPYLVFDEIKMGRGKDAMSKTFSIRLSSKPMTKHDAEMVVIQSFYDHLLKVHSIFSNTKLRLGSKEFNQLLKELRHGLEIKDDQLQAKAGYGWDQIIANIPELANLTTQDEFLRAYPALIELAKQIYHIGQKNVTMTKKQYEESEYKNDSTKSLSENPIYRDKTNPENDIYVLKNNTDLTSTGKKKNITEPSIEHGGAIVKALNAIAVANKYLGGNPIRVVRTGSKGYKYFVAKSITAEPLTAKNEEERKRKKLFSKMRELLMEAGFTKEELNFRMEDSENLENLFNLMEVELDLSREDIESMAEQEVAEQITEDTFKRLLSFDSNGNHNSEGFYLRKPIKQKELEKLDINKKEDREKILGLMGSKLKSITPTAIEVTLENISSIESETTYPKEYSVLEESTNFTPTIEMNDKPVKKRRRAKEIEVSQIITDLSNKGLLKTINC